MYRWAILFLVFAVIAGIIGFMGLAIRVAAWFAQLLFFLFLVIFVVLFIAGYIHDRRPPAV